MLRIQNTLFSSIDATRSTSRFHICDLSENLSLKLHWFRCPLYRSFIYFIFIF